MKNANGTGSVYKLGGKRRNPYAVVITNPPDETGRLTKTYLGYFATKKEADLFLAEYNRDPFAMEHKATFKEVYEKWYADRFYGDVDKETIRNYTKAYNTCPQLHDKPFASIRLEEYQKHCDTLTSHNQQGRFRSLIKCMCDWAIANDYATKNYGNYIKVKIPIQKTQKERFSDEEIEKIFSLDTPGALMVQCLLYTGVRINELLDLRREDCHIDNRFIYIRKSKTYNGIRVVPLHNKILPVFKLFYDMGNEYVFTSATGKHMTYDNWRKQYFDSLMKDLDMHHTTHECRHTFASLCAVNKVPTFITKKVLGHAAAESLTERVYTHITVDEMLEEINKIP